MDTNDPVDVTRKMAAQDRLESKRMCGRKTHAATKDGTGMTMYFNIKKILALAVADLVMMILSPSVSGQTYVYTPSYAPAPPVIPAPETQPLPYTAAQLDEMLGPIALYPDPLLSEILAASTYPQDLAAAGEWLQYNSTPSEDDINSQSWDPSVRALAHFPDVVRMMATYLDWTEALGTAFANQQADVMDSVQRLRAQAQAANTLVNTPQQEVVQDGNINEIIPTQPDVIYVPQYDPDVVYTTPAFLGPYLTFGPGYPFDLFLDMEFDFGHHRFLRGVPFDRNQHRFDFDHGQPWRHDPSRPIPAPPHPFPPPRGTDSGRGWEPSGKTHGGLHPQTPRVPTPLPTSSERPVRGLPPLPNRTTPPVPPSTPVSPGRVPIPSRPTTPAPSLPQPRERPVTGLPHVVPAPRIAPPPARQPSVNIPMQRSAPPQSPAFHPDGGAGAAAVQGHSSMHR